MQVIPRKLDAWLRDWNLGDFAFHSKLRVTECYRFDPTGCLRPLDKAEPVKRYQDDDPDAPNYDPALYVMRDGTAIDEDGVPVFVPELPLGFADQTPAPFGCGFPV